MTSRTLPVAASILLLGLAASAARAKDPALQSLSLEHFRDTATVSQTAPDATVISTEKGFATHAGPLRMVWNDEFLESIIDDKTGRRSFQVDAMVIYSGAWRSYETANFQTAGGPRSLPLTKVGKEVANCAVGECTYTERVAFPVDEEFLRRQAAGYAPGAAALWSFKIVPAKGPAYVGTVSSAEIAGLLAKVDEYTGALPVFKTKTATAALKLDLGIAGLAVAATDDHPNRAGVLIIGVDRGSVAQKSGIIIGDIVYEFDGRPVKALTELQAAVAACAADAAAVIKVYRGIEPLALTVATTR